MHPACIISLSPPVQVLLMSLGLGVVQPLALNGMNNEQDLHRQSCHSLAGHSFVRYVAVRQATVCRTPILSAARQQDREHCGDNTMVGWAGRGVGPGDGTARAAARAQREGPQDPQ